MALRMMIRHERKRLVFKNSQQGNEGTKGTMQNALGGVCGEWSLRVQHSRFGFREPRSEPCNYPWLPFTVRFSHLLNISQRALSVSRRWSTSFLNPFLFYADHISSLGEQMAPVSSDTMSCRLGRLGPEARVIEGRLCQTRPNPVSQ